MITRDQVVANSYLWADGTVEYAQIDDDPTDDEPRPDCSGYVGGLCWSIKVPVNTVSLVTAKWMTEIPATELRPGDAIGDCGPGTDGNNGHIMLVTAVSAKSLDIAEQAGGGPGPQHRTIKAIPRGYKAYRFRDIVDSPQATLFRGDPMYVINAPGDFTLWLSDGFKRTPIYSIEQATAYLTGGAAVRVADVPLAWFGKELGAETPVQFTAEQLAQLSTAARQGAHDGAADAVDGATIHVG